MTQIFLGLGSNLGDRAKNLRSALASLAPRITVQRVSPVYETEPQYVREQPRFLNMAVEGETTMSAREALDFVKRVERELGRRDGERFGPRIIDIDLLFYGAESFNETGLTVPHPKIAERAFVLVPLRDIAPDFVHPVLMSTVRQLAEQSADTKDVRKTEVDI